MRERGPWGALHGEAMKLLAGVAQMTSGADLSANLTKAVALVAEGARRGAQLLVLPENFALLGEDERAKFAVAEALDGKGRILATLREAAQKHNCALVLGGMPERVGEASGASREASREAVPSGMPVSDHHSHVHNACVYLDQAGEVKAIYRKIHLFDVEIPDGATYRESASVKAGTEPITVETPWGPLGLSVCYDLRFPELYRKLALSGARMIVVPAAFTLHTGRDHWHPLLRARAIENLAFVLAAGQVGRHNPKRVTYGHSLVVDPWGQILTEMGDREGVAVAELDFAYQDKVRRELPSLSHRRL